MSIKPTQKTVASIGDALICLIPENAQDLRYSERFIRKPAGAELNTLIGLSRLGMKTQYITELEEGALGYFMEHYLAGEKIELFCSKTSKPTPLFIKETMPDGSIKATYYRTNTAGHDIPSLPVLPAGFIENIDMFLFSGIFPALSSGNRLLLQKLLEKLQKTKVNCVFDPNIRLKLFQEHAMIPSFMKNLMRFCDILLIGETEGALIFKKTKPDELYSEVEKLGIKHLVIKKGREGSIIYELGKKIVVPPVSPKFILDTCGAGDAYNAGYIYALMAGFPAQKRGEIASVIASQIIQSYSDNQNYPYLKDLNTIMKRLGSTSDISESDR